MIPKSIKKGIGLPALLILSLIPLIIWVFSSPLELRFGTISKTLKSFGQMTALVGVAMFSLTFVLSARLKWLEDYFNGLPRMYVIHHVIGATAFILLLLHPLFITGTYLRVSLQSAAEFLLPGTDWAINFGILALFTLILLIVFTLYIEMPYHIWKITHKFMGVPFFLAALHILLIDSDITTNFPLKYSLYSIMLFGFSAYTYRTLLGKFLVKKLNYIVKEVKEVDEAVIEITMIPTIKKMNFAAGQFMFFSFKTLPEWHPFSISSSPQQNELKITAKALGDYTEKLKEIKPNTPVKIEGPYGRFTHTNAKYQEQIWVAGGIGITPFLSMIRQLKTAKEKESYNIVLFYSVRTKKEALFLKELQEISTQNKNIKIIPWFSDEKGHLTLNNIKALAPLEKREFFLCCPPAMLKSLKKELKSQGISKQRIHSEEFKLL